MRSNCMTRTVVISSIVVLATSACGSTILPQPPSPVCTQVASGKIVHLYPAEDWRTDGSGDRGLGSAFTLDSSLTVKRIVEDTTALSLGCLGFQLYEAGPGVPEVRVAVVSVVTGKGDEPQAAQVAPASGAYPEQLPPDTVLEPIFVSHGGANIVIKVRFGMFWPQGVQVIDRELTAQAQGPYPPAQADDVAAQDAYAKAIAAMVSMALQQLADQVVLAFADQGNLIASLPTAPVALPASYGYPATQPEPQPGAYAYQTEPLPSTQPAAGSTSSGAGEPKAGKKKKGSKAGDVLGGLLGGGKKAKGSKGSGPSQPATTSEPASGTASPSSPVQPPAPVSDAQANLNAEYLRQMHDEDFLAAREAIAQGADPLCILTDKQGYSELHAAVVAGDIAMAKQVLAKGNVDIDSGTKDGVSPLHMASALGDLPMVKYLVGQGANPAYTDIDASYAAPNWAAMEGHLAVVKYYIEQVKLDVDLGISPGIPTPLIAAALTGQMPVVKYLLAKKADIDHEGLWNETALHGAAQNNHPEMCKFLIQKGANVNAISEELETPLHNAARYCPDDESCVATVKVLMDNGADKYAEDDDGNTAMDYAKENGDDEIMKYLASH